MSARGWTSFFFLFGILVSSMCTGASVLHTKVPSSWRYADTGFAQLSSAAFLFADTSAPVFAWPTLANVPSDVRGVHVHDALLGDGSFLVHRDAAAQVVLCAMPRFDLTNDTGLPPLLPACTVLPLSLNASRLAAAVAPLKAGVLMLAQADALVLCGTASCHSIQPTVSLGAVNRLAFDSVQGVAWIASDAGLFSIRVDPSRMLLNASSLQLAYVPSSAVCSAVSVAVAANATATDVAASFQCAPGFGVFARSVAAVGAARRTWWRVFTPGVVDEAPSGLSFADDRSVWIADGVVHRQVPLDEGVRVDRVGAVERLPINGTRCIATTQFGSVFVGTTSGVLLRGDRDTRWRLLRGGNWLPGGRSANFFGGLNVGSIAELRFDQALLGLHGRPMLDGVVLATDSGIAVFTQELWTLRDKADFIQQQISDTPRFWRFNATSDAAVSFGDVRSWSSGPSANDGLHTGQYVISQAYRFGSTNDADAYEQTSRGMDGMEFLNRVTGVRGVIARAAAQAVPKGSSGPWWTSNSSSGWFWWGDASSDEVSGHVGSYPLVFDLAAVDSADRARAATLHTDLVMSIIQHGYHLIDVDGSNTSWGVWAPALLNGPEWEDERGLNSAMALGFLAAAAHLNDGTNATASAFFRAHFQTLVKAHGYGANIENMAINNQQDMAFFDDNLGRLALRNLLYYAYGRDPAFDRHVDVAFPQWWRRGRRSRITPDFYLYGAWFAAASKRRSLPADVPSPTEDLETHVRVLQQWPLFSLQFPCVNSDRWDLGAKNVEQAGGEGSLMEPLPRDQVSLAGWAHGPDSIDGGGVGDAAPKAFLEAYWIGAFHGFL
jgi:hypothetical protein